MANYEHVATQTAVKAFLDEVKVQSFRYGYRSQAALADALDVSQVTMGKYMKDPDVISMRTMRKLVRAVRPNPAVFLRVMGYTPNEIRDFVKENRYE